MPESTNVRYDSCVAVLKPEAETVDKSVLRGISVVGFGITIWKLEAGCWKLEVRVRKFDRERGGLLASSFQLLTSSYKDPLSQKTPRYKAPSTPTHTSAIVLALRISYCLRRFPDNRCTCDVMCTNLAKTRKLQCTGK